MKATISVKIVWERQDRGKTNFRLIKIIEYRLICSFLLYGRGEKMGGKRKTHEDFVKQLAEINPNLEALEEYFDSRIKIKFKCDVCGHIWEAKPSQILIGKGCPVCARNRIAKTQEQFVNELNNINPNIDIIGRYINSHTKISCKCKLDEFEWNATPSHLLRGQGCPECDSRNHTKTHSQFIKELRGVHPDVKVLDNYVNNHTKLQCECLIDGNKWYATPNSLLSGHGCPECWKNSIKLDEKTFFNKAKEQYPNIKILTNYTKASDNYLCECKICGYKWETNGTKIIQGKTGCRECYRKSKRLTNEEFLIRLNNITNSIIPLEKYYDSYTKIKFKCKVCNNIWKANPLNILYGNGCPKCNKSNGERCIEKILEDYNIKFVPQKTFDKLIGLGGNLLSYDFYLPKYNLLIEFQGKQHEEPIEYFGGEEKFKIQQEHDKRKREYAQLHNINLLEIWYYDIDNIESILLETINNLKLESVETVTVA